MCKIGHFVSVPIGQIWLKFEIDWRSDLWYGPTGKLSMICRCLNTWWLASIHLRLEAGRMDLAAVITPHIAVGKVNIAAQWLRLSFASVFTSLYWSGGVCCLNSGRSGPLTHNVGFCFAYFCRLLISAAQLQAYLVAQRLFQRRYK